MAKIPIALQLYSVREDCARDFPGTLEAVADMGYEGVEFAGYYGRSAAELRRMLESAGLRVAGSHVYIDALLGDELQRTIQFNRTLGNEFLIVPWLPAERRRSKAEWLKTAHLMNN
jgi:sugar phosphate isomerase/epimerase